MILTIKVIIGKNMKINFKIRDMIITESDR